MSLETKLAVWDFENAVKEAALEFSKRTEGLKIASISISRTTIDKPKELNGVWTYGISYTEEITTVTATVTL